MFKWRKASIPPAYSQVLLEDGLCVEVAFLTAEHAEAFSRGYSILSKRSRQLKLYKIADNFSFKQIDFLTNPDGFHHIAYVAILKTDQGPIVIGSARSIRKNLGSAQADTTLFVVDEYQHRGLGLLLHTYIHRHANAVGIKELLFKFDAKDARLFLYLSSLGATVVLRDEKEINLKLTVCSSAKAVDRNNQTALNFKHALAATYSLNS